MIIEFSHRIAAAREAVFRFHSNPANLEQLLVGWRGFELLRHDGNTAVGSTAWVRQRFFGIVPIVSGFRHTEFTPPERFAEELTHGPFRHFRHVHEFEADGEETIIIDKLDVRLHWYLGGETMTRLIVARFLRAFFRTRHSNLDRLRREHAFQDEHEPTQA